jgi:hypothetical protein
MPVGGETLHAPERLLRHLLHHAQCEAHHAGEDDVAQRHDEDPQSGHGGEHRERGIERYGAVGELVGDHVDEAAGKQRHQDLGDGQHDDTGGNSQRQRRLAPPLRENEPHGPHERTAGVAGQKSNGHGRVRTVLRHHPVLTGDKPSRTPMTGARTRR